MIHIAVSVGLVWESAKSGVQHIRDVVNYCIGTTLDLSEVGVIKKVTFSVHTRA